MSGSNLAGLQRAFARHVRDPRSEPPQGIEPRRMRIYGELVYNNIEGFICGGFPVLRSLFDDRQWRELVSGFVARHRCRTPLFLEIGEEFMHFIATDEAVRALLPPFAAELAHYEWVELALDIDEDEADMSGIDAGGDLLAGIPVPSPLALPLAYRFPVHRISASYRPERPDSEPNCLVVYRDATDRVRFLEVNALTLRMLELLGEGGRSGEQLAAVLSAETGGKIDAVRAAMRQALRRLRELGIVLGVREPPAV